MLNAHFTTSEGSFTVRLYDADAPNTVANFVGLAAPTMQAIAKEMNFSETTFVLPPEQPGTDFRVRIFTPAEELPMAGPPTIGTTFALARAGLVDPAVTSLTLGLGLGPTPVSLTWKDDDLAFVWMTQLRPTFGDPVPDRAGAAAALRLPAASVAGTGLPVQIVSCGVPFLFVPLATRGAVDNAVLDADAYDALRGGAGLDELPIFLFSSQSGGDRATVYSRMFAPNAGIAEDPATGGASGALGCYLLRNKVVTPEQAGAMLSLQGFKMGRPSYIHIAIGMEGGEIASVRVGGESVVAGEGTLYL